MILQNELIASLRKHADRIAIENGCRRVSYGDLLKRSDKVTGVLLAEEIPFETNVGILMPDTPDIIVSIIGILNARLSFVPIDLRLPVSRIADMTVLLELTHIIVSNGVGSELTDLFVRKGVKLIYVEELADLSQQSSAPITYPLFHENDSVYVYFTSGTTGLPKGIIGRNASLCQFINWEKGAFDIKSSDRFSQFISPYFDAFLRDIFVPLFAGATICCPESKEVMVGDRMASWIDDENINIIHCVPSVFRIFNVPGLDSSLFHSLRYILLSGEKIVPAELSSWYKVFGDRIQLANFYGATETTMIRACYLIQPKDAQASRISIGSPIADTELLVLNGDIKPCEILVPGDIYIVSDFITKGYLKDPAMTAEKFVYLSADVGENKKAFKTGDKARILPDGSIDLIGREDRQVKIQGVRIELDELEHVLIASGWISQALVVVKTENNIPRLIAFAIPKEHDNNSLESELMLYLLNHLPAHSIPSQICLVQEFPLLPNGKTNYKVLLGQLDVQNIILPETDIEIRLLAIWKEILDDKEISTDASFHTMGGNSISIMRLIGRIYKDFNVRISLAEIFNNLTVKKQATLISSSVKDSLYVIDKCEVKPYYRLSSVQQRIYYNYEVNKSRTSYNLPMAWEITNGYDEIKIISVFKQLLQRHESLRTRFGLEKGEVMQFVDDETEFVPEMIDCADQNVHSTVVRFCRPFDLMKGPLFRVAIITTALGRKIMAVDFHHIICDGVSQIILLSNFSTLYYGGSLTPLKIQYKDYSEWEYKFRRSEEYMHHREFWLKSFEGNIPKLNIPTATAVEDDMSDKGGNFEFVIPYENIQFFLDYVFEAGITNSSAMFSAYLLFLSQFSGQDDLVVGVASAGRIQQEVENIVGMFVKTLPVRCSMESDILYKDFLRYVHSYLIQANSKQTYDLADIVGELNNNRATPVQNLFDVQFVFLNFSERKKEKNNYDFNEFEFENPNSKSTLILYVREDEAAFYCRMEYSQAYFTRSDVEMLSNQFTEVLDHLSNKLDQRVIDIIGVNEKAIVLDDDISFNF